MVEHKKYLTRGPESKLNELPVLDGKLRFTTDTGRLFMDLDGIRLEISDFIKTYTEEEIKNIITPLPKIYLSRDTLKFFVYANNKWNCIDKASHAVNADTSTYSVNAGTSAYSVNASTASFANKATNADTATYANKATNDVNGKQINTTYAPLASPVLTGTPTVPTPSTDNNSKQIANTEYVTTAITNAIAGVTQFDTFVSVSLPETGKKGVIYFIPEIDSKEGNLYIEYLWVDNKFEKIGSTKIDLSGYVNSIETTGTGNAITSATISNGKITYTKGSTFLTKHPSITTNSSTLSQEPLAGETIKVVDEVTVDANGHVTSFRTKSVKFPALASTATNADTATYARSAGKATQDSSGNNINSTYIKNITASGRTVTFTKGDNSTGTFTTQDTVYTHPTSSGNKHIPSGGSAGQILRWSADGTAAWGADNNTTYANMKGSTTSTAGAAGLAPAPAAGAANRHLRCDGTWQVPSYASNAGTANGVANEGDFDFGDIDG